MFYFTQTILLKYLCGIIILLTYHRLLTHAIFCLSGCCPVLPCLPHVPGDEGVGDILEVGPKVTYVEPGDLVVLTPKQLGTWCYYGIYHENDTHKIPPNIPLAEACMLTIAPTSAYSMLTDFKFQKLCPGQTVIQNGANSPIGQSVIQICKAMGVHTINIVATHCGYEYVKEHLMSLGATYVYTLEEAEELACCCLSFQRPTLALSCLGGRYEDVMLMLLERHGTIVYYGEAYNLPYKQWVRNDLFFNKFHLSNWNHGKSNVEKDFTYKRIQDLIVSGKFKAPLYVPLLLKDYGYAFRNTCQCEAFSTLNYVFDFTLI